MTTLITAKEAAAQLNGSEYPDVGSKKLFKQMKDAGLVAVYGCSDDNVELEGAISDEIGAYNGTTVHVTGDGLCISKCSHGEDCPYYRMSLSHAKKIHAIWCPDELSCSWLVKTEIPHETFDVMEAGELFCRGIVFYLEDVK